MLLPIPLLENCCTRNTCRRRMFSRLLARLPSWRSTVESSTWIDYQKSSCRASRSNVSSQTCVVWSHKLTCRCGILANGRNHQRPRQAKGPLEIRRGRYVTLFNLCYTNTDNQSYSTITRQFGDPGTIENPLSGVSHVVILPVSLAFLLFRLT